MTKKTTITTMTKLEQQEAKILRILEKGETSTSNLAFQTGLNFYQIGARLNDLEGQGKIVKSIRPKGTFWSLRLPEVLA